jgi:hypothetical protein
VFQDSDQSERAALALFVLSLSLAMNEAIDCENFRVVFEICRNQIESPIETLKAAACSSVLGIVKTSIKFGAPLNALIGPMLAALVANRARVPAAIVAMHTIVFNIALPVQNLIEICKILFGTCEAADDWEGEALFLLVRIILMAADAVPVEFAEFAIRADPGIATETAGQLLFAISDCILFLPAAFASRLKQAILQQFGEKVFAGQTKVYTVDLFRISDHI